MVNPEFCGTLHHIQKVEEFHISGGKNHKILVIGNKCHRSFFQHNLILLCNSFLSHFVFIYFIAKYSGLYLAVKNFISNSFVKLMLMSIDEFCKLHANLETSGKRSENVREKSSNFEKLKFWRSCLKQLYGIF